MSKTTTSFHHKFVTERSARGAGTAYAKGRAAASLGKLSKERRRTIDESGQIIENIGASGAWHDFCFILGRVGR